MLNLPTEKQAIFVRGNESSHLFTLHAVARCTAWLCESTQPSTKISQSWCQLSARPHSSRFDPKPSSTVVPPVLFPSVCIQEFRPATWFSLKEVLYPTPPIFIRRPLYRMSGPALLVKILLHLFGLDCLVCQHLVALPVNGASLLPWYLEGHFHLPHFPEGLSFPPALAVELWRHLAWAKMVADLICGAHGKAV